MASVRKRTWTHKGETKSAWVVSYTDQGGKRRIKTFDKKKEADAQRTIVETEIGQGSHVADAETVTVKHACDAYIRDAEDRLREGRIGRGRYQNIERCLRVSVLPHLSSVKLKDLTAVKVLDWYSLLSRGRRMSPCTAKARVYIFRLVEIFSLKRKWTRAEPIKDALKELKGVKAPQIQTFTSDDVAALLRAASLRRYYGKKPSQELMCCAVHLAAFCGLRYGEIMGLTLPTVDLDARVIYVRHNLTAWDELKGPKTAAGNRDVPMPQHIADLLARWIDGRYVANPRKLVFRSLAGTMVTAPNFHTAWKPLLARAGLSAEFHFHALRHFAASWMIESGMSMMDVSSLLGHSKFDVTLQVYAHPVVGGHRRHEAFDRMATGLLSIAAPGMSAADATTMQHGIVTH